MQKRKQKKVSLWGTVNEIQNQLMAMDSKDNEASLSDNPNQETPTIAWVKCGHLSMDISICSPVLNNHPLTKSTLG
jgi:hypothetical protein